MNLPSDEEIKDKCSYFLCIEDIHYYTIGAKWMRSLAEIEIAKLRTEAENVKEYIQEKLDHELDAWKNEPSNSHLKSLSNGAIEAYMDVLEKIKEL